MIVKSIVRRGLVPTSRYNYYYPLKKRIFDYDVELGMFNGLEAYDDIGQIRYLKIAEENLDIIQFISPQWGYLKPRLIIIPKRIFPKQIEEQDPFVKEVEKKEPILATKSFFHNFGLRQQKSSSEILPEGQEIPEVISDRERISKLKRSMRRRSSISYRKSKTAEGID
jgi:hypothetical protein